MKAAPNQEAHKAAYKRLARRVGIVRARAIPVITETQLRRIEYVVEKAEGLQDELHDLLGQLTADLAVLLGGNRPDGWRVPKVLDDEDFDEMTPEERS